MQCLANVLDQRRQVHRGRAARSTSRRATQDGAVTIIVTDTGVGIAPELLPQRVRSVRAGRTHAGSLAGRPRHRPVHRQADHRDARRQRAHQQRRRAARHDLRAAPAAVRRRARRARPHLPIRPPRARRILVVDDNEDAANTLAMILKLEGHEVDTAYSGAQALERLDDFQPAVVLLDIGLPGIDGYEVAERMRAKAGRRAIQLIAITGYGQEADRLQGPARRIRASPGQAGRFRGSADACWLIRTNNSAFLSRAHGGIHRRERGPRSHAAHSRDGAMVPPHGEGPMPSWLVRATALLIFLPALARAQDVSRAHGQPTKRWSAWARRACPSATST